MEGPGADIAHANYLLERETEPERLEHFRWHLNELAKTYPLFEPFVLQALAAPDLVRVLLAVEWSAMGTNYMVCPVCGGIEPGSPVHKLARGHEDGCALNEARCTELLLEVRRYRAALTEIAGCDGGIGHMPETARKALTTA